MVWVSQWSTARPGLTGGALPDGLRHEEHREQLDARELQELRRVTPPPAVEQHQRRVQDQDDAQHDAAPEGDAPRPARKGSISEFGS